MLAELDTVHNSVVNVLHAMRDTMLANNNKNTP